MTQLPERWSDYLVSQPETGMGYQYVDIQFEDGKELRHVVVISSEWVDLPVGFNGLPIKAVVISKGE